MKTIAKQDDLLLNPAKPKHNPERLLRRKDSRFWQAQFRDHTGKLIQRTTGCIIESSALAWLAAAQRDAARKHDLPPANAAAAAVTAPLFPA